MRVDPAYHPITVAEFLAMDFGSDRKFELDNGVIHMMTGGSAAHARVAGNLYFWLRAALDGSDCQPFNSDMGLKVDDITVRYPDIAIYRGKHDDVDRDPDLAFDDPHVVIEVLSPSTTTFYQGTKLYEYMRIASVQAIVFVDPVNELTRVHRRVDAATWHDNTFAQPHDIELPTLGLVIPEKAIFRRR